MCLLGPRTKCARIRLLGALLLAQRDALVARAAVDAARQSRKARAAQTKARGMSVEILVLCLQRYGEHRAAKHVAPSPLSPEPRPFTEADRESLAGFLSVGAIWGTDVDALAGALDALAGALSDPIRATLRLEVRDIGWRIFANGGTMEMHRIADLVAEAMPDQPALVFSTLDKWWDGIGSAEDQWRA
jgi:hypothetical protein